jgi:transposase InsO family protein
MPTLPDRPDFAERAAPTESSSRARALEEALTRFGAPEIFNPDQGAQLTDSDFTDRLKAHGVAISMDGSGVG